MVLISLCESLTVEVGLLAWEALKWILKIKKWTFMFSLVFFFLYNCLFYIYLFLTIKTAFQIPISFIISMGQDYMVIYDRL